MRTWTTLSPADLEEAIRVGDERAGRVIEGRVKRDRTYMVEPGDRVSTKILNRIGAICEIGVGRILDLNPPLVSLELSDDGIDNWLPNGRTLQVKGGMAHRDDSKDRFRLDLRDRRKADYWALARCSISSGRLALSRLGDWGGVLWDVQLCGWWTLAQVEDRLKRAMARHGKPAHGFSWPMGSMNDPRDLIRLSRRRRSAVA